MQVFSFALRPLTGHNEFALAGGVTLSYLVLYTGYDKTTKRLSLKNLTDLVTCGRGIEWTLVELNKLISLAGITTLLMSFIPDFKSQSRGLLGISMVTLWTHSVYSMYKWYGFKISKVLEDKPIKKLSILLGVGGQLSIVSGFYGYSSFATLALASTALSIGHFWTMEVDYKYKLQVRPYAYLPFVLAIPAIVSNLPL
jgi:hypothetical protein